MYQKVEKAVNSKAICKPERKGDKVFINRWALASVLLIVVIAVPVGYYFYSQAANKSNNDTPNVSVKDVFVNYMVSNNVSESDANNFYGNYTSLVNPASGHFDGFVPQVMLFNEDTAVYGRLVHDSQDSRITIDRDAFLSGVCQDFLNSRNYGNVSVWNAQTKAYDTQKLSNQTIDFRSNITLAQRQLGLAPQDNACVSLVENISQVNPNMVNFNPINLAGYMVVPQPARESWSLVGQTKSANESIDVLNNPGLGTALATKTITNNWCAFDNPYGLKYFDKGLKVDNASLADVEKLQFSLYSQFAPINGSKAYSDFTWWNDSALKVNNPDMNGLRASMFNLWQLPSMMKEISTGNLVTGVAAANTSLTQSASELKDILAMYPDGNIFGYSPTVYYDGFLGDRGGHGLSNTIGALLNIDPTLLSTDNNRTLPQFYDMVKNNTGPDGYLSRTWQPYNLANFIIGYERGVDGNVRPLIEDERINYIMPGVLNMAGFPVNFININPIPLGASTREIAINLPQSIAQSLKQNFPNDEIRLSPGYGFSPYSMNAGLAKDGSKPYIFYGDTTVWL